MLLKMSLTCDTGIQSHSCLKHHLPLVFDITPTWPLFLSLKKWKGSEEVINNGHVRMNILPLNPLYWLLLLACILNVGSLQGSVLSILSTLSLGDVTLTALVKINSKCF